MGTRSHMRSETQINAAQLAASTTGNSKGMLIVDRQ